MAMPDFVCNGHNSRCYYTLRNLPHHDFDKTERMSLWQLARLLQGSRTYRTMYGRDHTAKRNPDKHLLFVRTQNYEIYPAFYSNLKQNQSVQIVSCCSYIGKTSYCLDEELIDLLTREMLVRASIHAVVVSKETRRPVPLPIGNASDVLPPEDGTKRPIPDPTFPRKPLKYFTQKMIVMPSHTDNQNHMNQAAYFQFSTDAIGLAAINGNLSALKDDVSHYNASSVWIRYANETLLGDEVDVSCWEDETDPWTVWVELSVGSKIVSYCRLQFYNDKSEEKQNRVTKGISKL